MFGWGALTASSQAGVTPRSSLQLPLSAQSGTVKILQNRTWSNALPFTVSSPPPSITLSPSMMNMLVGQTRTIEALNGAGGVVSGLTWATSDSTIVSLSSD